MPTLIDHIFVCVFAVLYPLWGYYSYQRSSGMTAGNQSTKKIKEYIWTVIELWVLGLSCLLIWFTQSRSSQEIGFGLQLNWQFWLASTLVLLVIIYYAYLCKNVAKIPENQKQNLISEQALQPIIPHTQRELYWFYAMSVTAGITEEILWRGYLLWYVSHWGPIWMSWLLVVIAFGYVHIYLGRLGVIRATLAGAVLLGLYWFSGSLWLPMLLHAVIDISQGRLMFLVVQENANKSTPEKE